MRCHICNSDSDTVTYEPYSGTFTPCSTCQAAIFECVHSYKKLDDSATDDYDDIEYVMVDVEDVEYDIWKIRTGEIE